MDDLKITVPVYWRNPYILVIGWKDLHLMLEILDKLLRHHVFYFYFTYVESCAITLPHLVLNKVVLLVGKHNWNFSLSRQ